MKNAQRFSRRVYRTTMRRAALTGLASLTLATGCASMTSPTSWFASKNEAGGGIGSTVANTGKGISGQVKTMGSTVSSAMAKAKNFVTSPFGPATENGDPTSLANMPSNLGPEIWVTNGQVYETQGKFEKAAENYAKALAIEPNNEAATLSMARLNARQKRFPEAEQYFGQALNLQPQAEVFNELALLQQEQGKLNDAQVSLQKAIEMDSANPRYRNNLASMLVSSGRSDEAVNQLQAVFPPAVANYNVAYLHFSNQNLPAAQQHLQLALQADPNLKQARDLMAKISNSPTTQSAVAAYQTANQIYRTAQAATSPTVDANTAIYSQPAASPAAATAPTGGYPSYPTGLPTTGYGMPN